MSRPAKTAISYGRKVRLALAFGILLPILLLLVYNFVETRYSNLREQRQHNRHLTELAAARIRTLLNELRYQAGELAGTPAVRQLAGDLLQTERAQAALDAFVTDHELVAAALIADGSPYIVEASPRHVAALSGPSLIDTARKFLAADITENQPQLHWFSDLALARDIAADAIPALALLIPIQADAESAIPVRRTTAALVVFIDNDTLLDRIRLPGIGHLALRLDQRQLIAAGTPATGDETVAVPTDLTIHHRDRALPLHLEAGFSLAAQVPLWTPAQTRTALVFIVTLLFAGTIAHRLTRALTDPVHTLLEYSRQLTAGRFDHPSPSAFGVVEVDELSSAFRELADNVREKLEAYEQAAAELRRQSKILETTSRMARIGGWELDLETLTPTWSAEVYRIHEVPPDYKPTLETAIDFYAPEARPVIRAAVELAVQDGTPWDLELPFITAKGRRIWVRAMGEPEFVDGRCVRLAGCFQDITERKQAEEQLRDAHQEMAATNSRLQEAIKRANRLAHEARAASEAKSEFLAMMSHEIRTPMNGVLGYTQLLQETPLTPEQQEYVHTIRTSGEALLALINDILDYSKIEAGKLTLEFQVLDLREIVEDVAGLLAVQAESRGLELIIAAAPDLPTRIRADLVRVRQVIINLVGNALKFTERGHVRIEIAPAEDDSRFLRCAITDTGIGIPPNRIDRLFKRFSQADASTTRRFGGTGLGLAICKRLVQMMGGAIGVTSTPGQGSTFWFTLPLHPSRDATPFPPAIRATPRHALIVTPVDGIAEVLTATLERWSFRCTRAADATTAEKLLRSHADPGSRPVLILLEQRLHDNSVGTLARTLKHLAGPGCRLVLLTRTSTRLRPAEAHQQGIDAVLPRPLVRPALLFDALGELVARGPIPAANATSRDGTNTSATTAANRLPPEGVRVLLAEDNLINQKLAATMLRRIGCVVDVASDGREAVELAISRSYDIIFMDGHMPEMDGIEATAEIRRHLAGRHVPIVAFTAAAMHGDRERCLAAGMDDYLTKPIRREHLLEALRRHTRAGQRAAPA